MIIAQMKAFLKKNYASFSSLPPNVPKEHYQWVVFANYLALSAILFSIGYLCTIVILKLWLVSFYYVVVLTNYTVVLFLQKKGLYKIAYITGIVSISTCAFILTPILGWNSGRASNILLCILITFYVPFFGRKVLFPIVVFLAVEYIAAFVISQNISPYYVLSHFRQTVLQALHLLGFGSMIMYIPYTNKQAHKIVVDALIASQSKNEELERLSELKDYFLANTSHELRTPLHGIIGIAESLYIDERVKSSAYLTHNLDLIITSARRLANLVNDILDFTKMRHNDLVINPQPVDIVQVTSAVLPNFTTSAAKKGLTLKTEFPEDLPRIYVDEDRLVQIIFNLVGNAIKFTDKGSITISAKLDGGRVSISVIDTGLGISPADLPHIFDAFEQSVYHHNNYRGGSGLGLSITKKLIELHGGTISVFSNPGEGSVFTFQIPVADAAVITSQSSLLSAIHGTSIKELFAASTEVATNIDPSLISVSTSSSKRIVLAIDDEPINLQILQNQLTVRGLQVVTAESAVHIFDLIELHKPDVILLDIMMPQQNGYEVCRRIREHFTLAEMPVIFISAKNQISDLVLGFQAGGNDYVLKPFLHEELVARVEGQIHSREAFDAIREIASLKADLADSLLEKTHLERMQERLTRLLHSVDDALLVVNEDGGIVFANVVFCTLIGIATDVSIVGGISSSLLHTDAKQHNLLTAKLSKSKFTPVLFADANNAAVELLVRRSSTVIGDEHLFIFTMRSPSQLLGNVQISEWIIDEMKRNQERLTELEKNYNDFGEGQAVSQAITEFIDANERIVKQFILGDTGKPDPFMLGYHIMTSAMALWKESTGSEKWEFAEKSGLWKVHPDENGWQRTATLDKYLDFRKMPRFPRWNTIAQSAQFVIDEAKKRKHNEARIVEIERMVLELEGVLKGT